MLIMEWTPGLAKGFFGLGQPGAFNALPAFEAAENERPHDVRSSPHVP
jgi:hypothetical protein